jgi:hypothetical protein
VLKRVWLLVSLLWLAFNVAMIALDGLWARPDLWLLAAAPFWSTWLILRAARYIWHGRTRVTYYGPYRPGGSSRVG